MIWWALAAATACICLGWMLGRADQDSNRDALATAEAARDQAEALLAQYIAELNLRNEELRVANLRILHLQDSNRDTIRRLASLSEHLKAGEPS